MGGIGQVISNLGSSLLSSILGGTSNQREDISSHSRRQRTERDIVNTGGTEAEEFELMEEAQIRAGGTYRYMGGLPSQQTLHNEHIATRSGSKNWKRNPDVADMASSSSGPSRSRPSHASPYVTGGASKSKAITRKRRSNLEDDLAENQQADSHSRSGIPRPHPTFQPNPSSAFYGEVGYAQSGPRAALRSSTNSRYERQPSPTNSYTSVFAEEQTSPKILGRRSHDVSNNSDHPRERRDSEANAQHPESKGSVPRGGFGSHGPSSTSKPPAKKIPIKGKYIDPSDEEDEIREVAGPTKEMGRAKVQNRGKDPTVKAIGITQGELKAKASRGKPNGVGKGSRTSGLGLDEEDYELQQGPSRLKPSGLVPKHGSIAVKSSFFGPEPYSSLGVTTLSFDKRTGICTLPTEEKIVIEFSIAQICPRSFYCSAEELPYLQLSFSTDNVKKFVEAKRHFYDMGPSDELTIYLHLESAPGAASAIQAIVNYAKSHGQTIDYMDLNGAKSCTSNLPGYGRNGRLKPTGAQSMPGQSAERPITALDRLTDKSGPEPKAKLKPRNKKSEPDADPTQGKLQMTKTPKPAPRKSNKEDPVEVLESPEAKHRESKPAPLPTRASSRVKQQLKPLKGYGEASGDDDGDIKMGSKPADKVPFPATPHAVLFPYPLQGRADINITQGDRHRVISGDFLNDTLIEFGLKHVLAELRENNKGLNIDKDVHLFNSFFYEKLSSGSVPSGPGASEKWPAYDSVRKWTKNSNIFNKKFLIVPINENAHWYFAVIFDPGRALVPFIEPSSIEDEPSSSKTDLPIPSALPILSRASVTGDAEDDADADKASLVVTGRNGSSSPHIVSPNSDIISGSIGEKDPDAGSTTTGHRLRRVRPDEKPLESKSKSLDRPSGGSSSSDAGEIIESPSDDKSSDPLLLTDEPIVSEPKMTRPRRIKKVYRTSDIGNQLPDQDEKGTPFSTPTTLAYEFQNRPKGVIAREVEEEKKEVDTVEEEVMMPAKKAKASKPSASILADERPWVMTFDSLGGKHYPVEAVLGKWLQYEAEDKFYQVPHHGMPTVYREARVPQQDNFSDCGLYLIHYVQQLLKDFDAAINFIELAPIGGTGNERTEWLKKMHDIWDEASTSRLRETWTGKIDGLAKQFDAIRRAQVPAADPGKTGAEVDDDDDEPEIRLQSVVPLSQPLVEPKKILSGKEGGEKTAQPEVEVEEDDQMLGLSRGLEHTAMDDVQMDDPVGSSKLDKGKGKEKAVDSHDVGSGMTLTIPQRSIVDYETSASEAFSDGDDDMRGLPSPKKTNVSPYFQQTHQHIPFQADHNEIDVLHPYTNRINLSVDPQLRSNGPESDVEMSDPISVPSASAPSSSKRQRVLSVSPEASTIPHSLTSPPGVQAAHLKFSPLEVDETFIADDLARRLLEKQPDATSEAISSSSLLAQRRDENDREPESAGPGPDKRVIVFEEDELETDDDDDVVKIPDQMDVGDAAEEEEEEEEREERETPEVPLLSTVTSKPGRPRAVSPDDDEEGEERETSPSPNTSEAPEPIVNAKLSQLAIKAGSARKFRAKGFAESELNTNSGLGHIPETVSEPGPSRVQLSNSPQSSPPHPTKSWDNPDIIRDPSSSGGQPWSKLTHHRIDSTPERPAKANSVIAPASTSVKDSPLSSLPDNDHPLSQPHHSDSLESPSRRAPGTIRSNVRADSPDSSLDVLECDSDSENQPPGPDFSHHQNELAQRPNVARANLRSTAVNEDDDTGAPTEDPPWLSNTRDRSKSAGFLQNKTQYGRRSEGAPRLPQHSGPHQASPSQTPNRPPPADESSSSSTASDTRSTRSSRRNKSLGTEDCETSTSPRPLRSTRQATPANRSKPPAKLAEAAAMLKPSVDIPMLRSDKKRSFSNGHVKEGGSARGEDEGEELEGRAKKSKIENGNGKGKNKGKAKGNGSADDDKSFKFNGNGRSQIIPRASQTRTLENVPLKKRLASQQTEKSSPVKTPRVVAPRNSTARAVKGKEAPKEGQEVIDISDDD